MQPPDTLEILYRDDRLVAVHKPAGLLVHRSAIDRHETRFALQMLRDQIGRAVFPVHRLDKPTSGVLLFALDAPMARELGAAFEAGAAGKRYVAVVRGYAAEKQRIDYPLREEPDPTTDRRARPDKAARAAITELQRLAIAELPFGDGRHATSRYSLVEARPFTGRRHQLRRHLKHIFHPIIGDTTHGDGRHNRLFREHFGCHRLLLAAVELRFAHPATGAPVRIAAPPAEDFLCITRQLGWPWNG